MQAERPDDAAHGRRAPFNKFLLSLKFFSGAGDYHYSRLVGTSTQPQSLLVLNLHAHARTSIAA